MKNNNSLHTYVVLAYKESRYLEDCIKSVLEQNYHSNVVVATSTPNEFINSMAKKYDLEVMVNPEPGKGIGYDFDFAVNVGKTKLVTVAHQDDIYDKDYSIKMVEAYMKNPDSLIIFSDYYEIRNDKKVESNTNLKIKRILLTPLRIGLGKQSKFIKRSAIRVGNAICCPAVTFVKDNIPYDDYFACELKCNIDWYAWERLSRQKGAFVLISDKLMGHRVHEESTTTEIIGESVRTQEDLILLEKFWPKKIAAFINNYYKNAEKSNQV